MAKGPHAALIPVSCFFHFCVTRGWKRLRLKHIPLLVFFGLLPALPWILARMARDGFHFFAQMLLVDVFARSTTVVEEHAGDWLYYIRYLLSFPGVVFAGALSLVGGILLLFSRRRLTNAQRGLILWLLIPILLFSAAVSKAFWYVFPILVPLAMAGGMAASAILRRTKLHGIMALCLALPLTFFITQNIRSIWETQSIGGYGKAIVSILDRDFSNGLHIYVERQELPEWRQAERLYAQLAGDALCLDGGRAAFEQDEKRSLLLVDRGGSDHETLAEFYPLYYEDSNVLFYDNLGES